jgi:nucleoid DNA-binding protein
MNTKELIAKITAEHADVAPNKVKAILKAAFDTLHADLETAPEGKLVSPLGAFRISVKPGKEGGEPRRRLTLNLAKSKEEKAEKADPSKVEEKEAAKAARKAERLAARKAAKPAPTPEERAARRAARKAEAAKAE